MAAIHSVLDEQADSETRELVPEWFRAQSLRYALISAAVFAGHPPEVVTKQARRLACIAGAGFHQDEYWALEELLRIAEVRIETVRHGPGDAPVRVVFARSRWAKAILRRVWQGPLAEPSARWLRTVSEAELIIPAGRALALSAVHHLRLAPLTQIRSSAISHDPCGPAVAAAALQTIMADTSHTSEIAARLSGWASGSDERLRHVTALTCGGGAVGLPVRVASTLIVRLLRSLEADHSPRIAGAVDEALMDLFHRGDRTAVLRELEHWTESHHAEAIYATTVFPRLLSRYLTWFHAHITEESGTRSVALLICRVLRSRSGSALRATLLTWQRFARLDSDGNEAFESVMAVIREDRHPGVRRMLAVLDQQY
jgi:hypothetical protein